MIDELDRDEGVALMDDEGAEKKAEEAQVAGDDQVKGRQAEIYQIDMDHASKVLNELDRDEGVALMDDEGAEKKAEEAQVAGDDQEVVDVVTTDKLITEVVTAASEYVNAASITIAAAEPQVPAATLTVVPSKDKGKRIMVEEPKPMKKKQQVKMDEEYARKLHEELNKDIDWNVAIDHVKQKAKENSYVQKYQHLEILHDEDDDVYTEATPLARKVPDVDYEIIHFNNKPHYKIIQADGTHQLYVSFITLLKNFDREDLESLWSLVKERFSTSKPTNFFDDYLLTTLGAMFERPDGQAQVWKNQRTVYGQPRVKGWKLLESCGVHIITFTTTQLILLVERRYPLSRFTLDQILNAVRLRVKEQSEMSLELLRFTRQQHQEGQLE
nr:hypothetical protein [Tanacetum cinerariifolium]